MKILFFALCLFASAANALDANQKQTLQLAAIAEPSISQCIETGNDVCVADWFNAESSFVVWRTRVSAEEYHNSAIVWTAVDGLTNGKARIWEWMSRFNALNPSQLNVRQGFADAFGANSATSIAALALSKRPATNAEKALATGTGTTGAPGLLTYEGRISVNDVSDILRP